MSISYTSEVHDSYYMIAYNAIKDIFIIPNVVHEEIPTKIGI